MSQYARLALRVGLYNDAVFGDHGRAKGGGDAV